MKSCVIKIHPFVEGDNNMEIDTGDLSDTDIYTALDILLNHFSRKIVATAEEELGTKNPKKVEAYINRMFRSSDAVRSILNKR